MGTHSQLLQQRRHLHRGGLTINLPTGLSDLLKALHFQGGGEAKQVVPISIVELLDKRTAQNCGVGGLVYTYPFVIAGRCWSCTTVESIREEDLGSRRRRSDKSMTRV